MKYSPTDIALMKPDIADSNVPDKASEVRPFIIRGKTHMADGVDEEDEDEEYREEVLSDWNLRK